MTDEKIFELAETCGIGANKYKICTSWEEELLEFARKIYSEGYEEGYDQGCYEATGGQ